MALRHKELTKGRIFLLKKYIKFKAFLQGVNYILVFFIGLLLFSFASLLIFRNNGVHYTHTEEIPKLEMFFFTLNRFNAERVDMAITADKGMQYSDKEVYKNFFGSRFNDDESIETLEGKEVWHYDSIYDFVSGIRYTKTPAITFFSEKGMYNTETDVFQGSGDFFIEDTQMQTNGKNIFYNKATDTITAKDVTATIMRF